MKKAPNMPKVQSDDEIERHKAYTRLNPKGDKEFVDDEETLNELADSIDAYVNEHKSDAVNNSNGGKFIIQTDVSRNVFRDKYISRIEDNKRFMESSMSNRKVLANDIEKLLVEWEPTHKEGEYSPGDHKMVSPSGDGVMKREVKKSKVGKYDTNTKDMGKLFGRKHKETVAMCDVDEDGIEHEPQGGHESTHGEPDDGHTTELGHNWPNQPKNSGSGVAEPFEGSRWSDGGTLSGGSGVQSEDWSPEKIGLMMEGDFDLQALFDNYARDYQMVCVEDFQALCNAHGCNVRLNEQSLLKLMENNNSFIFYAGEDANGPYWCPTAIAEGKKPVTESRKKNNRTISEFQIRSPDDEFSKFSDDDETQYQDQHDGPGFGNDDGTDSSCPECGAYNIGDEESCPECGADLGYESEESIYGDGGIESPIGTPEDVDAWDDAEHNHYNYGDDARDSVGARRYFHKDPYGTYADYKDEGDNDPPHRDISYGPHAKALRGLPESIGNFMRSAKRILEENTEFSNKHMGEALGHSWMHHVGRINPNLAPSRVKKTLANLAHQFPGFTAVLENAGAMTTTGGTAINQGSGKNSSSFFPESDTEMNDEGELLGRKQTNDISTPELKGTAKGLDGKGSVPQAVKENVARLSKHVQKALKESTKGLRGKYNAEFSILVSENGAKNRTPIRYTLSEALIDAEEILQFHTAPNVELEAVLSDSNGTVVLKQDIPLLTIKPRGLITTESKALFRFSKNAEIFANKLVSEGYTCRIVDHNWGKAVQVRNLRSILEGFKKNRIS